MSATPPSPVRKHRGWPGAVLVGTTTCAALVLLAWFWRVRAERADFVTSTPTWSVDQPVAESTSPTGYAGGVRWRIVPGHYNPSYRWIADTQRAVAGGTWRVHQLETENFPAGRPAFESIPYRAWLALIGWLDHVGTGRSLPLAIEHGALFADPVLQGLTLLWAVVLVWRMAGAIPATGVALALATWFPGAGAFAPGAPDGHVLAWALALGALLPVVLACLRGRGALALPLAGVCGGLAIWTNPAVGEPVVLALALAAIALRLLGQRFGANAVSLPWRAWSFAGAATCAAGYLVEYVPSAIDWSARAISPLHVLAWLGLGELLHQLRNSATPTSPAWTPRRLAFVGVALLAVAALPVLRGLSEHGTFLETDNFASTLTTVPGAPRASNVWSWMIHDGLHAVLGATLAPLLILFAAGIALIGRSGSASQRSAILLALGPVAVAVALACMQLRWWSGLDCLLVALVAALGGTHEQPSSRSVLAMLALALLLAAATGLPQLIPPATARGAAPLSETEAQSVVERDLALWLAQQRAGSTPQVVLTTPSLSETLAYHAGARGVASLSLENRDGLAATVRIASASTDREAFALLDGRRVTHLIVPSWDPSLDLLARVGRQLPPEAELPANTFIAALERWQLYPWLYLKSYHGPKDRGASDAMTATVFEIQAEQDEILATCRLADYFLEMGLGNEARTLREKLQLYPRSLPALAALAQIDLTLGDTASFQTTLDTLLPYTARRGARSLTPDRRISLAALLVQARQMDPARDQVKQAVADLTLDLVRDLSTAQIVRLLAMNDLLELPPLEASLRSRCLTLLPPALRAKLLKPGEHVP